MKNKSYKAFYRFKDLNQSGNRNLEEQFNIVQKVPDDGVEYEFMISFYRCKSRLDARLEIFDSAFVAFEKHSELFDELSKVQEIAPDEMERLLLSLNYKNLTKEGM